MPGCIKLALQSCVDVSGVECIVGVRSPKLFRFMIVNRWYEDARHVRDSVNIDATVSLVLEIKK